MKVKFNPNPVQGKLLRSLGMPGYLMRESGFTLDEYIRSYVHSPSNMKPKAVSLEDQLGSYDVMLKTGTRQAYKHPYLACVSSEPNDLKAKIIVASVMLNIMIKHGVESGSKYLPKWHTVLGGFDDSLKGRVLNKDSQNHNGLLILSNVIPDSTQVKKETLRDLLELHSSVPRIVVTTGSDPMSFFNSLGFPLNFHLWLKGSRMVTML